MAKSEENGLAVSPRPKKTARKVSPQIIHAVTVPVTAVFDLRAKVQFISWSHCGSGYRAIDI